MGASPMQDWTLKPGSAPVGSAVRCAVPKKDRPHVDRHPQKNGEGWLLNEQEQLVVCFHNALPSAPPGESSWKPDP